MAIDPNTGEYIDDAVQQQSVIPPRKGAGYEQYITTQQLAPEIYPNTPVLDNIDYFPNADQPLQIGSTPSTYFGGGLPIFSGEGNLFPINTYTKRARALETAAYQNQLARLRKQQQGEIKFKNLFKTPDFKDPFYSQQLYNVTNDFTQRIKDELVAEGGGTMQGALEVMNNPKTPQQRELVAKYYRGMGQIKSMDNVVNYLAGMDKYVMEEEAKGNYVLPSLKKALGKYHEGSFDIGNPNMEIGLQEIGVKKNVNDEYKNIIASISEDINDRGDYTYTEKDKEKVKAVVKGGVQGDLTRWAVAADMYEQGKPIDEEKVLNYWTDAVDSALKRGRVINERAKERLRGDKPEKTYDVDRSDGGTYPVVQFTNKATGESKVTEIPTTAHWDVPNIKEVQGLQIISSNWLSPETGKGGSGAEERTGTRKVDVSAIDKFYVVKNKELGTWEISPTPTNKQMLFATVNSTGELSRKVDEAAGTQKEFTATYLVPYDDVKGKLANARINLKGIDEQPKNISQEEYAKLKKGDKYYFNGQEYTKQ